MRPVALLLALLLAPPALAQRELFFGNGKPPVFKENDVDRKFLRSKLARALSQGTQSPDCVQLLGGLFTALGEVAPYLHKKDENFMLDPYVLNAVQTQLSNERFPGTAYLLSMVRRVLIDRRLPDEWLATAEAINPTVGIIDLGKLRMLNEGVRPVDGFAFSLLALRDRYAMEVLRANSAVTTDVAGAFRDTYLDRDVAWGGAVLVDVGVVTPKGLKKKKPTEIEELGAVLVWEPPDPNAGQLQLFKKEKVIPVKLIVRLAPKQYLDLERVPRGKRLIVKGRFWEMNKTVTEVEVRDALLLEDRDFSQGVLLADPAAVWRCPLAVNEITGIAPQQPGGFKH